MRHIRIYENVYTKKVEQFFKPKVDWKFVNYLMDKSTKYEDMGKYIQLEVSVLSENTGADVIYELSNGKMVLWEEMEYIMEKGYKFITMNYELRGLFYRVGIYTWEYGVIEEDMTNEYYESIKNNCIKHENRSLKILTLTPKEKSV